MTAGSETNQKHVTPLFVISISDLFANVNAANGDFVEYIPDGSLDEAQIKAIKMSPAAGGFNSTGAYSGDTISVKESQTL